MSRETIAVDVDEVLAAKHEALRLYVNELCSLDLQPADYAVQAPYWLYYQQVWSVDREEESRRFQAFRDSGAMATLPVVDGAQEGVASLAANYDLVVVTARHSSIFDITCDWVEAQFPNQFQGVEFSHLRPREGATPSKTMIYMELGASAVIDDCREHCDAAAELGLEALQYGDYPWSNLPAKVSPGVVRLKTWELITDFKRHGRST